MQLIVVNIHQTRRLKDVTERFTDIVVLNISIECQCTCTGTHHCNQRNIFNSIINARHTPIRQVQTNKFTDHKIQWKCYSFGFRIISLCGSAHMCVLVSFNASLKHLVATCCNILFHRSTSIWLAHLHFYCTGALWACCRFVYRTKCSRANHSWFLAVRSSTPNNLSLNIFLLKMVKNDNVKQKRKKRKKL